jgi:hypothetical protein
MPGVLLTATKDCYMQANNTIKFVRTPLINRENNRAAKKTLRSNEKKITTISRSP